MKLKLNSPVEVGDLVNPVSVDELEIIAISLNFDPYYAEDKQKPRAILSIVLLHRASGYKQPITYEDASALEFCNQVKDSLKTAVWQKLSADKKLPNGTFE